jgi:hypothetical protein
VALLLVVAGGRAETARTALSDPTQPPMVADSETATEPDVRSPGLRLQAVYTGPKGEAALINGRMVSLGQRVSGALLRQVRTDGVLLERDGQTWVVPIGAGSIKRPAEAGRSVSP